MMDAPMPRTGWPMCQKMTVTSEHANAGVA